jgi:LCP family protein required for cell wall assembly
VRRSRRRGCLGGCGSCLFTFSLPLLALALLLTLYFLFPIPTHILVLGIDRVPEGTALGRSDTMILLSVQPSTARVRMLSIPRDLWVSIPGVGENRINTAHFFAESAQAGSGPGAAVATVEQNFGVPVLYYARLRFDAVLGIVDAMGGVTLNLPEDMGGLPAGEHHLSGEQALAFIRDRKGTDDFFRMERGQLMLRAIAMEMLSPRSWPRLPQILRAGLASVDTNVPLWQWPRLGFTLLRAAAFDTIDSRTIRREMTSPYVTENGADVLLPNWDLIRPFARELFAP